MQERSTVKNQMNIDNIKSSVKTTEIPQIKLVSGSGRTLYQLKASILRTRRCWGNSISL